MLVNQVLQNTTQHLPQTFRALASVPILGALSTAAFSYLAGSFSSVDYVSNWFYGREVRLLASEKESLEKEIQQKPTADNLFRYAKMQQENKDYQLAMDHYKLAAEKGHSTALLDYHQIIQEKIRQGCGSIEDIDTDFVKPLADKGNLGALYIMGFLSVVDLEKSEKMSTESIEKALHYIRQFIDKAEEGEYLSRALSSYGKLIGIIRQNKQNLDPVSKETNNNDFKRLKKAADQGNSPAIQGYATALFQNGKGSPDELREARAYLKKGAKKSNTDCTVLYWYCVTYGLGGKVDYSESRKYAKQIIETDGALEKLSNSVGQNRVNSLYISYADQCQKGEGGEKDLQEALKYYKIAADRGDATGIVKYAIFVNSTQPHESRIYVKKAVAIDNLIDKVAPQIKKYATEMYYIHAFFSYQDKEFEEARKYYKIAADLGYQDAKKRYAIMLEEGKGGEVDIDVAGQYFPAVAAKHLLSDPVKLSLPKNKKLVLEALSQMLSSASLEDKGKIGSLDNLIEFYSTNSNVTDKQNAPYDPEQVKELLKIGVENNLAKYMLPYALILERGSDSLAPNLTEARKWYKKAADNGELKAMEQYMKLCAKGKGGDINLYQARRYAKKAADLGSTEGLIFSIIFSLAGHGGERDFSTARKNLKQLLQLPDYEDNENFLYVYASMCQLGLGGEKDLVESQEYQDKYKKEITCPPESLAATCYEVKVCESTECFYKFVDEVGKFFVHA